MILGRISRRSGVVAERVVNDHNITEPDHAVPIQVVTRVVLLVALTQSEFFREPRVIMADGGRQTAPKYWSEQKAPSPSRPPPAQQKPGQPTPEGKECRAT